jgi:hypothetical protein
MRVLVSGAALMATVTANGTTTSADQEVLNTVHQLVDAWREASVSKAESGLYPS